VPEPPAHILGATGVTVTVGLALIVITAESFAVQPEVVPVTV
jgi:hypothetical protein